MAKDRIQNPEKYKKYLPYYREKASDRYRMHKFFVTLLKFDPCADCGGVFLPCVMDFDHSSGGKKKAISQMLGASMDRLVKELEKCELVCANCHRMRTWNRLLALS